MSKKITALVLVLLLAFTMVPTTYTEAAKKKAAAGTETEKKVKVKKIKIKGVKKLGKGQSAKLKAKVYPAKASNKKVKWKSSNPSVVKVTKSGKITAKKKGKAVITATAKDGSKVKKKVTIEVFTIKKSESNFVAHRGNATKAPENTIEAFEQAALDGFWGIECDVWETSHDEKDNFDLVLSHDNNFKRMTGVDALTVDLTAEEAKQLEVISGANWSSAKQHICFLKDFLSVCSDYNMVPVIDIKDTALTDDAVKKIVNDVEKYGLSKKVIYLSMGEKVLRDVRNYSMEKADTSPDTYFLSRANNTYLYEAMVAKAVENGFTGVGFDYVKVDQGVFKCIKDHDLKVNIWGFDKSNMSSLRSVLDKNRIELCTIDGKFYSE